MNTVMHTSATVNSSPDSSLLLLAAVIFKASDGASTVLPISKGTTVGAASPAALALLLELLARFRFFRLLVPDATLSLAAAAVESSGEVELDVYAVYLEALPRA